MLTQEEWNYWYSKVYGYFYRRLNSVHDVEDLTASTLNDFFLKEDVQNPQAMIWAIARNKFNAFLKSKYQQPGLVSLDMLENQIVEDDVYSSHYMQKVENLKQCVENQLSDKDRRIVDLSINCEFNSHRIAEELEMSSTSVRQRLSRAIRKLKEKCRQIWITA
ncbi:MAG: hypothetical protein OHK0017_07530 [Patescibacteria group bacterium]